MRPIRPTKHTRFCKPSRWGQYTFRPPGFSRVALKTTFKIRSSVYSRNIHLDIFPGAMLQSLRLWLLRLVRVKGVCWVHRCPSSLPGCGIGRVFCLYFNISCSAEHDRVEMRSGGSRNPHNDACNPAPGIEAYVPTSFKGFSRSFRLQLKF